MKNFKNKIATPEIKSRQLKAPPVTEYMVRKLITFTPETEISEVIASLLKNRITGAPVLNEKKEVVGLIDDKDCLNTLVGGAMYNHPVSKETVANYMSNVMKTITVNEDILDVANIFLRTPYKRLLVLDDGGKLVGQISRRDILRAIKEMKTSTW
ncbi:MAG: CBS domain-containing protein [Saprospiraceae bacterium]|nr:CBS domain-containing protein [Saprospiraceae bacterium]